MVGATPIDLKSNLLDNFTDIFGRSTPGINIHANIVNSFLQNQFRFEQSPIIFLGLMLAYTSALVSILKLLKTNAIEFGAYIGSLVMINILGIFIYSGGVNFQFLSANIMVTSTYVFYIAYKYFTESKEKRFIKTAFERYINPELLDELVESPDKLQLGGEKRIITVLFSDIRGFTTVSEKLSVDELIKLTNEYFDMNTSVIMQNGGTIDKYIGDAIMAFWNAPLKDDNHQLLAIRAGRAMQQNLIKFNADRPNLPDIKVGVGINTDEMIVGNIGSTRRFDYTLIGDGVNLASRTEGLTKEYGVGIIVSENVLGGVDITNENFIYRLLDVVKVKGKIKPVKLYEVADKTNENIQIKSVYEKAFLLYYSGKFKEAEGLFLQLTSDNPSKMMVERINSLEDTSHWDGVWEWKHK